MWMTGCKHAGMLAFSQRKELASRIMVVFSVGKIPVDTGISSFQKYGLK
jgi:hypothetical protein